MSSSSPLLAIGISFYNDRDSLQRCLNSLIPILPFSRVIGIDGAYLGFPEGHLSSTDGSYQLFRDFMYKHHAHFTYQTSSFKLWHERVKRQRYVNIAAKERIPFLLILDSDEYLEYPLSPYGEEYEGEFFIETELKSLEDISEEVSNVHWIRCTDWDNKGQVINSYDVPQLWYKPEEMEYVDKHYKFRNKITGESWLNNSPAWEHKGSRGYSVGRFTGIEIWHDHILRSKDRELKRIEYEEKYLPQLEQ